MKVKATAKVKVKAMLEVEVQVKEKMKAKVRVIVIVCCAGASSCDIVIACYAGASSCDIWLPFFVQLLRVSTFHCPHRPKVKVDVDSTSVSSAPIMFIIGLLDLCLIVALAFALVFALQPLEIGLHFALRVRLQHDLADRAAGGLRQPAPLAA